ncbi:MAG: FAD-dependent oxidoreductase [Pseudomonadota bacterium]
MMRRLPALPGEWLDRSRQFTFEFEGRPINAFAGDTLSSAIAAAGLLCLARSFKYHRRRGFYSAANHDANNLFQVGAEPNQRGDCLLAQPGMKVTAVNTHGGLERDRASIVGRLSRFLPVGFYYKAFGGRRTFPYFERVVRAMSGLGHVDFAARPARRRRRHGHCEVAVIGAGISGLAAGLAAARAGAARVLLVDENREVGGSGDWARAADPGRSALAAGLREQAAAEPAIEVLTSACAVGYYADHNLAIAAADRADGELLLLRADAVVLATGAIEQPIVFANNDLPGVMLASAAQRLLFRYALLPGERVVILGANDDAVEVALDLAAHGVGHCVLAVLTGSPLQLSDQQRRALADAGVETLNDCVPVAAQANGKGLLAGVSLLLAGGQRSLDCDALLLSGGWMPALQLGLQAGASVVFDTTLQQHRPHRLPPGLFIAGRANGYFSTTEKQADGHAAGVAAAACSRGETLTQASPPRSTAPARSHPLPLFPGATGKAFVDLDEDLTLADLANAVQEGFDSSELLKRYSTVGMGPSQGKLSNLNAARHLAQLNGSDLAAIALTTARPPYQPLALGALAGAGFSPLRRTAFDAVHCELGVVWMPQGQWRRPQFYARDGLPAHACIAAEAEAVRQRTGIIDVSTLGKIELYGADAALLLERLYTGRFGDMRAGTTRYALMVDETGTIVDDGVAARLAPEHFYVTTTSSAAAAVYREMQRRVAEWQLNCTLHNVTGHMAALNLAGPGSRALLSPLCELPLGAADFPYLAARFTTVAGVPARILRVGFVGELGYEIHVPYDRADGVWRAFFAQAQGEQLRAFGVEAQRLLRLEKGHVIVGQDTDGLTSPYDADMGWAVKPDKKFFVGQRSLQILKARGPRQLLAGFELQDADARVDECHLVIDGSEIAGRVTSVARSGTLGKTIGLCMLAPHLATAGTTIRIRGAAGQMYTAAIVARPFYDPGQLRQKAEAGRRNAD